jgi:molybdopterin-guanine dinucleotide biosynthesis protein A
VKPAGFVLTGGKSRRMGTDKAGLDWGGQPLVEHMRAILSRVADPVELVGPGGLNDREPGAGPVEGISTALEATESAANIVVAVDLPFLTPEWLSFLLTRLSPTRPGVVGVEIEGKVPLCLAIRREMRAEVDRYRNQGKRSLAGFLESVGARILAEPAFRDAGFDAGMFTNLNTPEDYARFRPR